MLTERSTRLILVWLTEAVQLTLLAFIAMPHHSGQAEICLARPPAWTVLRYSNVLLFVNWDHTILLSSIIGGVAARTSKKVLARMTVEVDTESLQ